ncbi:MAG: class I SAM-dependent methyltransferase [Planctomycetota bacterium]|nr:class I SAM-dependent methyltransferase [Planctomycetota bacterium]
MPPGPASHPLPPTSPAHVFAAQRDWPSYFDKVAGKPPRETLVTALDAFEREGVPSAQGSESCDKDHKPPLAIDLGCGEGRDTAELLRRGWRVLAIDGHPDGLRRLRERDLPHRDRLEIRHAPFEGLEIPRAMLINASFCLPFCPPDHFADLWRAITDAIEPGGRFAGQLFGDRDDWAPIPDRSHQTRAQARALFAADFTLERFDEVEDDGKDALDNPKHWHRFDVVAARQPSSDG